MLQIKSNYNGYNRNLMGGKRPHRKFSKFGNLTLIERLIAESKALTAYQKRVGQ